MHTGDFKLLAFLSKYVEMLPSNTEIYTNPKPPKHEPTIFVS
jgi:hypothetical protein